MTDRENLIACMRRLPHDSIPFQFSMCESLLNQLEERYGTKDVVEAFDMPVRYIGLPPTEKKLDYTRYHTNADKLSFIDEWGVGHTYGSLEHFTHMSNPMGSFTDKKQVEEYPFPDVLNEERWVEVDNQVKVAKARGKATAFAAIQVFEPAWYLRGLDNLLADMLTDEEMAAACLEKMTVIQCEIAKRAAQSGVDIIIFGDDVGTQRSLMMSIELWREWIKPATAATIEAAKAVNPDVLALYHSDGVIYDIIPELIEIGVDILNPVQPECVDPILLKELYGERLSFWGAIGTQTVMPFGTPKEVEENVIEMIKTVGKGGGFTVAPTHLLEPEVCFDNIDAFMRGVMSQKA